MGRCKSKKKSTWTQEQIDEAIAKRYENMEPEEVWKKMGWIKCIVQGDLDGLIFLWNEKHTRKYLKLAIKHNHEHIISYLSEIMNRRQFDDIMILRYHDDFDKLLEYINEKDVDTHAIDILFNSLIPNHPIKQQVATLLFRRKHYTDEVLRHIDNDLFASYVRKNPTKKYSYSVYSRVASNPELIRYLKNRGMHEFIDYTIRERKKDLFIISNKHGGKFDGLTSYNVNKFMEIMDIKQSYEDYISSDQFLTEDIKYFVITQNDLHSIVNELLALDYGASHFPQAEKFARAFDMTINWTMVLKKVWDKPKLAKFALEHGGLWPYSIDTGSDGNEWEYVVAFSNAIEVPMKDWKDLHAYLLSERFRKTEIKYLAPSAIPKTMEYIKKMLAYRQRNGLPITIN